MARIWTPARAIATGNASFAAEVNRMDGGGPHPNVASQHGKKTP
jgi:hypothetical protein